MANNHITVCKAYEASDNVTEDVLKDGVLTREEWSEDLELPGKLWDETFVVKAKTNRLKAC